MVLYRVAGQGNPPVNAEVGAEIRKVAADGMYANPEKMTCVHCRAARRDDAQDLLTGFSWTPSPTTWCITAGT